MIVKCRVHQVNPMRTFKRKNGSEGSNRDVCVIDTTAGARVTKALFLRLEGEEMARADKLTQDQEITVSVHDISFGQAGQVVLAGSYQVVVK